MLLVGLWAQGKLITGLRGLHCGEQYLCELDTLTCCHTNSSLRRQAFTSSGVVIWQLSRICL